MSLTIYIQANEKNAPKVEKIGGTNKAKKMVSMRNKRDAIEGQIFKSIDKSFRADKQRNDRRAKR